MKRLTAILAAFSLLISPALAEPIKPLVTKGGQVRQLPSGVTIQANPASTAGASINLPHGAAPAAPVNGDMWTTANGVYARVNGTTVGPIRGGQDFPIDAFGADPTGSANSDTAFAAALTAIGKTGGTLSGQGCVILGAGTYKFSAQLAVTLSSVTRNDFCLRGQGPNVSKALWPNAAGGIAITTNGQANSVQVYDLALLTSQAGGGTALSITNIGAFGGGDGNATNIVRVYAAGDDKTTLHDANTKYWNDAAITTAVSNVNYDAVSFAGAGLSGLGNGITYQGDVARSIYGVVCNISNSLIQAMNVGLTYGSWAQGITVSQTNFQNGNRGIFEPDGTLNTDQLTVVASQLSTSLDQILIKRISHVHLIGNLFFVNYTNTSAMSILGGQQIVITGNMVNGPGTVLAGTNGVYVYSNFSEHAGIITGNTFYHVAKGVWLDTLTGNWNVQGNSYKGNTANVLNTGTGNSVGVATQ